MKTIQEQIEQTTEVRRHGQGGGYGEWMPLSDDSIPAAVREAVADDIIEEGDDMATAVVAVGGQEWQYRR